MSSLLPTLFVSYFYFFYFRVFCVLYFRFVSFYVLLYLPVCFEASDQVARPCPHRRHPGVLFPCSPHLYIFLDIEDTVSFLVGGGEHIHT